MELKLNLSFENILNIANQLSATEKERLIEALKKKPSKRPKKIKERQLGKYEGRIWMADDFNAPLMDFKEYMP